LIIRKHSGDEENYPFVVLNCNKSILIADINF